MDFDAYAQTAADLVNTELPDLEALRDMLAREYWRDRATERDLTVFKRARKKLREVFEHGSIGEDDAAVEILNTLLESYPVQPRISGHPNKNWHMHVTGRGATVASEYLAGAAWGLSVWLCSYGGQRFGICADERCSKVYLDTSSNCCRRFCSERCATRSHVAAHRARKKEVNSSSLGPEPQTPREVVALTGK